MNIIPTKRKRKPTRTRILKMFIDPETFADLLTDMLGGFSKTKCAGDIAVTVVYQDKGESK